MIRRIAFASLFFLISTLVLGQDPQPPMTNADVVNMAKSGIGEDTILLAIQQSSPKFDTSPQALVELKKAGIGDRILNAMLASPHSSTSVAAAEERQPAPGLPLFKKALNAIGPADKVAAVRSIRYKTIVTDSNQGVTKSLQRESIRVYPEKSFVRTTSASGQSQTQVITPDFNYRQTGKLTTAVPSDYLRLAFAEMEVDRISIAQHVADCSATIAGDDNVNGVAAKRLRISCSGREIIWKVDPSSGRLLATEMHTPSGDVLAEYSDYKDVDGLSLPFKRHVSEGTRTSDQVISDLWINSAIDEAIFARPKTLATESLTLKVLQEQSVPYTQELGGGVNTSCHISGSGSSTATVNSYGRTAYGTGSSTTNMRMNCNSYDTTIRWQHVLNTMFVQASDGNAYIIACDRAWRWSKCVPLRTGQTFSARFTGKGIQVQAFNSKGKEDDPVYQVLQSKSME